MGKIILNNIEYGIGISNGVNVDTTNLVEKDSIVTTLDDTVTDEQIPSAKAVYDKLSDLPTDSGLKCYTSLDALGLTADASIEDVVNTLKNGESFLAPVNTFTNYETIFPNRVPSDQWNKVHIIKGTSLPNSHIRCYSQSGACEYLANVNNTNIVSWNDVSGTYIDISDSIIEKLGNEILKYPIGKYRINSTATGTKFTDLPSDAEIKCGLIEINGTAVGKSPFTDTWVYRMYKFECLTGTSSYVRRLNSGGTIGQIELDTGWQKDGQGVYTSLSQLGLDTTATINDIVTAMKDGTVFTYKTDVFDYATEYNNIQYGTVTIDKQSTGRVQVLMTDKNTGNLYVGRMDTSNLFVGWRSCTFHRVVAQATAGYFKFEPTSNGGFDQPLRISVTDNYGGMINISGAKPSASQYKPFKCIRLSNGEYTNYDAIKVANNKMLKLFYYDGYFYLKVATYTTCTFEGLLEAPTYVETFDEEVAEEIPIRSVFDTPYNDGYADPSIIVIGDTESSDGVIKTLNGLGFTEDIMTWDTGVYRLSHVGGLTNLPTEITEEKPELRLEHYDLKKWGSNHNPNTATYGSRQSVLHHKGNIFVRYTESGASAGVLTADTGWRKIQIGSKDIAKTALRVKVQTIADGSNFYIVKNGVCYVNYYFAVKNAESAGAIIFENLPKPAETMNVTLGTAWAEVRANSTNLYLTGTIGASASCVGNFSYPVAD